MNGLDSTFTATDTMAPILDTSLSVPVARNLSQPPDSHRISKNAWEWADSPVASGKSVSALLMAAGCDPFTPCLCLL